MSFDYRTSYTQTQYIDAVVELISTIEGYKDHVYKLRGGQATVGYGYTFSRNNNLALWAAAGITLTRAEKAVLQKIDSATTTPKKTNIAYSRFTRVITKDEAKALLRQTYPSYEGPANDLSMPLSPERVAFVAITYNRGETIVRNRMGDFYAAIQNGDRAEAWFQIRYNSLGRIDQYANGKAKARYLESQLFGLYKNSTDIGVQEAISVFKTLQRHRKDIYNYEKTYGERFDGEAGTRNMVAEANTDYTSLISYFNLTRIDTVNQAYDPAKASLFADLVDRYSSVPELAVRLADPDIRSTNIYLNPHRDTDTNRMSRMDARAYETGNYAETGSKDVLIGMDQRDIMYGGKNQDILIGEGGNDVLEGGKGDDLLLGGDGFDVYIYRAGDGNDKIVDGDNNGRIIFKSNGSWGISDVASGSFYKRGTTNIWTDPSGRVQITHNSPWQLVLDDGSAIQLGDNFQDGDFDIDLLEDPATPTTTNTITGDLKPMDFDPDTEGIQTRTDEWGNIITNPAQPDPGKNDLLYDTTGNDMIVSGGGADNIVAQRGGDDWMQGGDGSDDINASGASGNKLIEGGTGSDILVGGSGSDEVYAESYGEMEIFVNEGETASSINDRGEAAGGNAGDDFLYGSNARDVLIGGSGHDLLVGGGGDDVIEGDGSLSGASRDWWTELTITPEGNSYAYNMTLHGVDGDLNSSGDDDEIYAGSGNDFASGGSGEDAIYGGDGRDYLFGGAEFI